MSDMPRSPRTLRPRSLMPLLAALLLAPLLGGCVVKKSTHDSLLADRVRLQTQHEDFRAETRAELERRDSTEAELRERIARLEVEIEQLEAQRARAEDRFEEARAEVHRLDIILNERGAEARQLQERLQRLAAVEREVRQRNAIYEDVIGRFQSLIDGGKLSVSVSRGRMVIQLPQDILFGSGSATLGADGRRTLAEVGEVLAEFEERSFQVEGHTDNVPIATARFPSNWELSTARALSVVQVLVQAGVRPQNISGAGFGEFHPVGENDTPAGRRLNRRIEIVMLANLDVIAETQVQN
jgi:chemotaxis protein MotB